MTRALRAREALRLVWALRSPGHLLRGGCCVLLALFALSALLPGTSSPAAAADEPPVLLGLYPNGNFFDSSAALEFRQINAWIGDPTKHLSIGATFADLEFPNAPLSVPAELEGIWNVGAVPFVNLSAQRTALSIAQGAIDASIRTWADAYKAWVTQPGGRRAFLALLQEMNGDWVPYGRDPANFKLAFNRIRSIFAQRGVPANSVRWVFAPNGWSAPGREFELYYPGDATTDVVGLSAYNFGSCVWGQPAWDTFDRAMEPYLDRMRSMAPTKPIFITQTGTVGAGGDKSAWLDDTYTRLAAYPGVRAILYFHLRHSIGLPCDPVDWRFYAPAAGVVFSGLRSAVLQPAAGFGHWSPNDPNWATVAFTDGPRGRFDDVRPAHPFAGVPNVYYYDAVQSLVEAGVTRGCSTTPPLYCPDQPVTREQMAVFLLRAKESATYRPPACTTRSFTDTSCSDPFTAWIEELVHRGVTAGCGAGRYCPGDPVTREQMAIFLLRTVEGPGYSPPPCTTSTFTDVPCSSPFAPWVEEFVRRGITSGCGGGAYCPGDSVTRAQMAVFLVQTFGLP